MYTFRVSRRIVKIRAWYGDTKGKRNAAIKGEFPAGGVRVKGWKQHALKHADIQNRAIHIYLINR